VFARAPGLLGKRLPPGDRPHAQPGIGIVGNEREVSAELDDAGQLAASSKARRIAAAVGSSTENMPTTISKRCAKSILCPREPRSGEIRPWRHAHAAPAASGTSGSGVYRRGVPAPIGVTSC
jgi:hypothetical protein